MNQQIKKKVAAVFELLFSSKEATELNALGAVMSAEHAIHNAIKARAANDLGQKIDFLSAAIQELAQELVDKRSPILAEEPVSSWNGLRR